MMRSPVLHHPCCDISRVAEGCCPAWAAVGAAASAVRPVASVIVGTSTGVTGGVVLRHALLDDALPHLIVGQLFLGPGRER
jgi:hypothetical protein